MFSVTPSHPTNLYSCHHHTLESFIMDFPGFHGHLRVIVRTRGGPTGNRWKSQYVRLKYTFIKGHRQAFDTAVMCRLLGVSRSGFYAWLRKPRSDRAVEGQRLLDLIRAAYAASHGVYGAPRIFLDLREADETCSKHRVARIMRANHLRARYGYRNPRYARGTTSPLTPNTLQRELTVHRPNHARVTDITYVRTWEGWLHWPLSWTSTPAVLSAAPPSPRIL